MANLCNFAAQRKASGGVCAHENAPGLRVAMCSFPQEVAHDLFYLQQQMHWTISAQFRAHARKDAVQVCRARTMLGPMHCRTFQPISYHTRTETLLKALQASQVPALTFGLSAQAPAPTWPSTEVARTLGSKKQPPKASAAASWISDGASGKSQLRASLLW